MVALCKELSINRGVPSHLPLTSSLPFRTQDAAEPEDFAVNLLDHFMSAFGLDEVQVYEFVALNVICFPSGWCFNPDDVGNICCPF
ncbi:AGAP006905-PA-like protein [Anopheles sinensis]|uniref:AGAP006905-PA-like protein n=1 Tax=Anopheles sinensis TaxID=74873 RepID=A0A084WKR8_ANOSI|nr:AGAP006905-PA-like protein [Anopheles sinensis]